MEPGSIGNLPLRTEAIVSVECGNWHIGHAAIRLIDFYRVKSPGFLFHRRHGHGHAVVRASDLDFET